MSHPNERSQRIHDLRTTHTDFKAVLGLMRSGYRFDDEHAPGVFAQLEKALELLEKEISKLDSEWKTSESR